MSARYPVARRRRRPAPYVVGALAVAACLNVPGGAAASTPDQGTYAGIACGSGTQASIGYCLVALSFLSGTLGYGLSAPGTVGSPLVVGKTTDAGISWSQVGRVAGLTTGAPERPHLIFTSLTTGFAWGQGALERTTDGGAQWAKVRLPGRILSLVHQGDTLWVADTTCAATSPQASPTGCGIRFARSHDGGTSWSPLSTPRAPFGQGELAVAGETVDLAAWEPAGDHAGSASPRLLVGAGRGSSWASSPLPCPSQDQFPGELAAAPGTATLWLVCLGQPHTGLALYQASRVGTDWVKTFSASGPDGQDFALDAGLEDLQPISATRAYALTQRNGLLVTDDRGRHWSVATSPAQNEAMSGFVGSLDVLGGQEAWVALWTTVSRHTALFHTTNGGSSWLSPVLAGAPPITFPADVPACRSGQLEARFYGTQGGAGSWLSSIDIADDSSSPCQLESPASLELVNDTATNERSITMAMPSILQLTAATEVPPPGSGIEPGTQLASVLVTWPTLPNANSLLGGDGGLTCPVPLFTPAVARMEFGRNGALVSIPTEAATPIGSGTAPIEPICGWRVQAQVSAAAGS